MSYDEDECFEALNEEYGKFKYGSKKLSSNTLYWLGYITRYICYTRDISSKKLYKTIPLKSFIDNYDVYHTQSEEWVIARELEVNGLSEDIFDKNKQMKIIHNRNSTQ